METRKPRQELGRTLTMGIYRLFNTVTGRMLLGNSLNLSSHLNRIRTELRLGVYRHRPLQEDWSKYGEAAFRFDILEEYLPREDEEFDEIVSVLKKLEEKWAKKFCGQPQYTRITTD